ncbi:MAG: hypothetical protein KC457_35255, partial [Myxococcales bacterium]|nr:hypothetical protein [Myxococcales bacterium]
MTQFVATAGRDAVFRAFDAMAAFVVVCDIEGRVLFVNRHTRQQLDIGADREMQTAVVPTATSRARLAAALAELREKGEPQRFDVEVELRPVDGLSPSLVTWTDAKGSYRFDELGPGAVEISFDHGSYVPAEARSRVTADGAGGDFEIVLETGWQIDVLVRSAGRGDPIEDAHLRVGNTTVTTDRKGRAVLDRLVGV